MGKDVRGIERGKCACAECEDFMRSSDSVGGTSAAGTSESASPEKWKDEDLGGSRTQRANILNSQIVFCQNSTCPFGPLVPTRNAFATVS